MPARSFGDAAVDGEGYRTEATLPRSCDRPMSSSGAAGCTFLKLTFRRARAYSDPERRYQMRDMRKEKVNLRRSASCERADIGASKRCATCRCSRKAEQFGAIMITPGESSPFNQKSRSSCRKLRRRGRHRNRKHAAVRRSAGCAHAIFSNRWSSRPRPRKC